MYRNTVKGTLHICCTPHAANRAHRCLNNEDIILPMGFTHVAIITFATLLCLLANIFVTRKIQMIAVPLSIQYPVVICILFFQFILLLFLISFFWPLSLYYFLCLFGTELAHIHKHEKQTERARITRIYLQTWVCGSLFSYEILNVNSQLSFYNLY